MTDPVFLFETAAIAAKALKRWLEAGELDRLIELLDRRFGDETGLTLTQLQTWKGDEPFRQALFVISFTGDWDSHRSALMTAVLGLSADDPQRPTNPEKSLAEEVVRAIEELLPQAKEGDELIRYEHKVTRAELGQPRIRLATVDWAPERAQDIVQELVQTRPKEGARLQSSLEHGDVSVVVRGLIEQPPRWVAEDGSGLLYEALAATAEGTAQWTAALSAWEEAAERPDGDRVRALVRASTAAHILGDDPKGAELLAGAKAIDSEHPLVLLTQARTEQDAETRLSIVERVRPRHERQEAATEAERADALSALGRFDDAEAALAAAREKAPSLARVKEVTAELAVARNQGSWLRGERVDVPSLMDAAQGFLELRDEHRELGAHLGSVLFTGRAVDAYIKADRPDAAARLLDPDALTGEELEARQAREHLAELAINAQRPDLADDLLPVEAASDDAGRLIRAMAAIQTGDKGRISEAVELLDRLVADGDQARQAALPRLLAAVEHGYPWSEIAEERLHESERVLTSILKAKWLASQKRWTDAERELAPHYDQPRAQHQLIGIALEEGDEAKVARRVEDLLGRGPDYAVRMDCAQALLRIGKRDDAREEFGRLAEDDRVPTTIRTAAYMELAQLSLDAGRHRELADLTQAWLDLQPDDPRAAWAHSQSLFRLGLFTEADRSLEERKLQPGTLAQAQLAARIYALARPPVEALTRIVELADAQGAPDEDLEMLVVTAALRAGADVPQELHPRVSPARFLELFPDTKLLQAIPAPKTEEEIRAFVQELAAGRAQVSRVAERGVFEVGDAPVAALAFASGKQVGELWGRLGRLPLGYGDESLEGLERGDALKAIAVGAVWDPASLFVAGGLEGEATRRIREALPKSVIAQSTVDDCLADTTDIRAGDERVEIGVDAAGEPAVTTWSEGAIQRDVRRSKGMLALAQQMDVEPDAPADDAGAEALFMRKEELALQFRTYAATVAIARRLSLAVFSDDRLVRIRARQAGIPAFGTLALLDALETRGYIAAAERLDLRRRLRASGALGTNPTSDELITEARENDFQLTTSLGMALHDNTVVRQRPGDVLRAYLTFLKAVFEERPDTLGDWTARVLDALRIIVPEASLTRHSSNFILMAWEPYADADTAFFQALVREVTNSASVLGRLGDAVLGAVQALVDVIDGAAYPVPVKIAVLRAAVDQLPLEERWRIRLAVFRPSSSR